MILLHAAIRRIKQTNLFILLPRDAMRKRGLCCRRCPSVRLSVRPSVTLVDCIHTAEDIVKLLFGPVALSLLFFFTPCAGTQFQGEPFSVGRKIHAGGNRFAIFDRNRHLSRKRYEIAHGTLIGNHSWRIDRYRFRWPWVTRNPGFSLRDKVNMAH